MRQPEKHASPGKFEKSVGEIVCDGESHILRGVVGGQDAPPVVESINLILRSETQMQRIGTENFCGAIAGQTTEKMTRGYNPKVAPP